MPKIICANCKAIEDVDEAPPARTAVLCSDCKKHQRSPSASSPTRRNRRNSTPQRKHGTRVMLPITCVRCGDADTLDYVPKGADLDDVLCSKCAREEFGTDSDWARIERQKKKDSRPDYEFTCDECGRTDYLHFEPKDDRTYLCNLCMMDHDTPSKDRLAGRQKAAGGVFIRRQPTSED